MDHFHNRISKIIDTHTVIPPRFIRTASGGRGFRSTGLFVIANPVHYICDVKTMYVILGCVSLGLGILGAFLPVLPTTPFLLLTAALFCKGSPRLYRWLMNHKTLGPYIRNYREYKAIPLRAKIISVTLLWITILLSAFLAVNAWWLRILLVAIAAGVTWHVLSFKTLKKEEGMDKSEE